MELQLVRGDPLCQIPRLWSLVEESLHIPFAHWGVGVVLRVHVWLFVRSIRPPRFSKVHSRPLTSCRVRIQNYWYCRTVRCLTLYHIASSFSCVLVDEKRENIAALLLLLLSSCRLSCCRCLWQCVCPKWLTVRLEGDTCWSNCLRHKLKCLIFFNSTQLSHIQAINSSMSTVRQSLFYCSYFPL